MLRTLAPKSVSNLIGKRTTVRGTYLLWEFLQYDELIHDVIGTLIDMVLEQFAQMGRT